MRKRVGITHDVKSRKEVWKRKYPNLHSWEVVRSGLTYEEAQKVENEYIEKGYEGASGGDRKFGSVYIVYTFSY